MDDMADGFVLVSPEPADIPPLSRPNNPAMDTDRSYLPSISDCIDGWSPKLRPISLKIHDNPELNYKEHLAHATLTQFFQGLNGWEVIPRAYGIQTAFMAIFDSGRKGPVVSFNAEYGQ